MPDLPAFIAIRTAVGSAEETTQGLRRSLPAAERSEAIRQIVDALSRHLSGKEVLSKDALVKLVEDLALILKFPPLPQETGRAFIRRLTGFIEALPMPERLLLEKQLATRSLVQRVAVAATVAETAGARCRLIEPRSAACPCRHRSRQCFRAPKDPCRAISRCFKRCSRRPTAPIWRTCGSRRHPRARQSKRRRRRLRPGRNVRRRRPRTLLQRREVRRLQRETLRQARLRGDGGDGGYGGHDAGRLR